eukprot:gene38886-48018_t
MGLSRTDVVKELPTSLGRGELRRGILKASVFEKEDRPTTCVASKLHTGHPASAFFEGARELDLISRRDQDVTSSRRWTSICWTQGPLSPVLILGDHVPRRSPLVRVHEQLRVGHVSLDEHSTVTVRSSASTRVLKVAYLALCEQSRRGPECDLIDSLTGRRDIHHHLPRKVLSKDATLKNLVTVAIYLGGTRAVAMRRDASQSASIGTELAGLPLLLLLHLDVDVLCGIFFKTATQIRSFQSSQAYSALLSSSFLTPDSAAQKKKILLDERMGFDERRVVVVALCLSRGCLCATVTRALDNVVKSEGCIRLAVLSSRFGEMYAAKDKIAWFRELWEEPYESVLAQYEVLG